MDMGKTSRRSFMKGMCAGVAAPLVMQASALGQGDAVAANDRINVALIGCGGQGNGLLGGVLPRKDAKVVAVCDVNERSLRATRRKIDRHYEETSTKSFADYRELLAQEDIDAVLIATPDHWHALICIAAAKAGKDIYCEKPLTWSLGEGRAVVKAVKEAEIVFQVGSMQRSFGTMKRACELVRNGYLGKIKHINVGLPDGGHCLWVDEYPKAPKWLDYESYVGPAEWAPFHVKRLDWNWRWWMGFGGGNMMDWIGHHGDIAHMSMGWDNTGPVEIEPFFWDFSKERNNLYNGPLRYKFVNTYAGGETLQVTNMSDMPKIFQDCGDTGTQWFGEDGKWLFVSRGGIKASDESLLKVEFQDSDFRFREENHHMYDFLDCIRTRKETAAPVEAGHRSASIGHLGKIACTLEHKLKWDPVKETFVGNEAVNRLLTRKYRGDWSLS